MSALRIALLHGPNLAMLGRRPSAHYGTLTLRELEERVRAWGVERGMAVAPFQTNHEGALIDRLEQRDDPCGVTQAGTRVDAVHDSLLFCRGHAFTHSAPTFSSSRPSMISHSGRIRSRYLSRHRQHSTA